MNLTSPTSNVMPVVLIKYFYILYILRWPTETLQKYFKTNSQKYASRKVHNCQNRQITQYLISTPLVSNDILVTSLCVWQFDAVIPQKHKVGGVSRCQIFKVPIIFLIYIHTHAYIYITLFPYLVHKTTKELIFV
jgi:hypothetical protein